MLFTKFKTLKEEDFAFFRLSFSSKRQAPSNIVKGLYGSIFLQAVFGLIHFFALETYMDELGTLFKTLLIVSSITSIVLTVLSIIFSIPKIYRKRQDIQYLVMSLMFFDIMGTSFLALGFFLLDIHTNLTENVLLNVFIISVVLLLVTMCFIFIRLKLALQRGDFREDSNKLDHEKALESDKNVGSKISKIIVPLIGSVLILQFILRNYFTTDFEVRVLIIGFLLFPYLAVYILSNSLISYYCKKRFKSFNFDENEELYPLGSGDRMK